MKTDKTDKIKTKRDFLFKATSFVPIGDFIQLETVYIEKAMQEHTDQAIAEFKMKLKEDVRKLPTYDALEKDTIELSQVEKLIDTTTI